MSIASLSLEEKGKLVENQKKRQLSWSERWSSCCQLSYVSQIWSVAIYRYRDLHCGLYRLRDADEKIIPTGREEEKRGFEKIDGQLSKRERKLRVQEQTLQKSAVHWSQQWRGRQRELLWVNTPVTFTSWNLLMKKHILGYSRTFLCIHVSKSTLVNGLTTKATEKSQYILERQKRELMECLTVVLKVIPSICAWHIHTYNTNSWIGLQL